MMMCVHGTHRTTFSDRMRMDAVRIAHPPHAHTDRQHKIWGFLCRGIYARHVCRPHTLRRRRRRQQWHTASANRPVAHRVLSARTRTNTRTHAGLTFALGSYYLSTARKRPFAPCARSYAEVKRLGRVWWFGTQSEKDDTEKRVYILCTRVYRTHAHAHRMCCTP